MRRGETFGWFCFLERAASMLEHRNLKVDLFALAILVLTIFLSAAVLSYDPADPPSKLVFPERMETLNVCGRSGAVVSSLLLDFTGLGAYYLCCRWRCWPPRS